VKDTALVPVRKLVSILVIVLLLNQSIPAQVAAGQAPAAAQSPAATQAMPAQIRTAQKIFLANAGAQTGFPYDSSVAYQQLADQLRAWGRYTLADTPAEADLIFQLKSAAPIGGVEVYDGRGASYRLPRLELTIVDPHTQTPLWVLTENVYSPVRRKDKTDWFTVAVANLTTKVKELAGAPVTPAETAQLEQFPRAGHRPWLYAVILGPLALGVAGGLILHHEYENSLANMKASQDAFCEANHIPLSECAGG